jgi:hypothetical protein
MAADVVYVVKKMTEELLHKGPVRFYIITLRITQYNDTEHDDTEHNSTQYDDSDHSQNEK